MKRSSLWLLLALLSVAPLSAQEQSVATDRRVAEALHLIDLWLGTQQAWEQIPAISVAVVHDQDLLWSKGYGYANVEEQIPAAPDTIYSICSISKLFTSISVMQLRDEGMLRLDDALGKQLSWFDIQRTYPEAPEITLRGILTHSSGLPREADFPYWTGPDYPFPSREEVIERLAAQETLYPADTYYQYSNLGMTLAGEVVAAVSGQPYADYVRDNVLEPLGLHDTQPEIPAEHRGGRLAVPYSGKQRDGSREEIDFYQVAGIAPAAGFVSTVEDLSRFASWQFRLLEDGGHDVLHVNTLKEMQRVHWLDENWRTARGLGFSVSRRDDKTYVGHGGSCPGYRSQLSLSRKDEVAVVFMTNAGGVNPGSYTRPIFDIVTPAIAKAKAGPAEEMETDPSLRQYVGRYDRPLGGETHAMIMDGNLVTLSLPTDNPRPTKLKKVGEHRFQRVRDDGELAEEVIFELGPDGEVVRMVRNSNYSIRVR